MLTRLAFPSIGSNARIHQLLRKLKSGRPISVGVIGGSVSTGHGLNRDGRKSHSAGPALWLVLGLNPALLSSFLATNEKEGPKNMHRQVYDWIQSKFPHKDHKFANGAIPASGEYRRHVPQWLSSERNAPFSL